MRQNMLLIYNKHLEDIWYTYVMNQPDRELRRDLNVKIVITIIQFIN